MWATSNPWNTPSACLWTWLGVRRNTLLKPCWSIPTTSASRFLVRLRQPKQPASSTSTPSTTVASPVRCLMLRLIIWKRVSGNRCVMSIFVWKPKPYANTTCWLKNIKMLTNNLSFSPYKLWPIFMTCITAKL